MLYFINSLSIRGVFMANSLHDGHRKRLREKFKKGKEVFNEHELLELLLCYSIARKDTNELAHKLISTFGSLSAVLSASPEALTKVEGVGETTASLLSLVNYITSIKKKQQSPVKLDSIDAVKKIAFDVFAELKNEAFFMFYLDGQKNVIASTVLDDGDISKVTLDFDKFSQAIMVHKPKSVIIMHNHFSKYPLPSEEDDKATAKIYAFLNFHKINLLDHVIVSGKEIYSYYYDDRLKSIKNMVDVKFS